MQSSPHRPAAPVAEIALRAGIVGLTLATAWIHLTLGGSLFTLNGLGYVVFAVAMVAPIGPAARVRWLTRLGLVGYTATTVLGWYFLGPRYDTAYVAKGIELVLISLLVVESYHADGSPVQIGRRLLGLAARVLPGSGPRPTGAA